jgi:hypothetical protein
LRVLLVSLEIKILIIGGRMEIDNIQEFKEAFMKNLQIEMESYSKPELNKGVRE